MTYDLRFVIREEVFNNQEFALTYLLGGWKEEFQYLGYVQIGDYLTFLYEAKFPDAEDATAFILKNGNFLQVVERA